MPITRTSSSLRFFKLFWPLAHGCIGLFASFSALSQVPAASPAKAPVVAAAPGAEVAEWLVRLHEASRRRAYTGTLVVSSDGTLSSSRIWHVCDGEQQLERVDTLTGPPRTTVRRNDEVVTLIPEARLAVLERRASLGFFPAPLPSGVEAVGAHYQLKPLPSADRIAGFDAVAVELQPRDDLRYGYRVWSEKKTGLVLKLQTLDATQRVLEQVAFTELQLDAPVKVEPLLRLLKTRGGYPVQSVVLTPTTPQEQGWRLRQAVPGFTTTSCHLRATPPAVAAGASAVAPAAAGRPLPLQWVLSDGMASVSLFVEPYDPAVHQAEGRLASGATHSLSRRVGDHWLTVVGEVPPKALALFAAELERIR